MLLPKNECDYISLEEYEELKGKDGGVVTLDIMSDDRFEDVHLPDAKNACVYETTFAEKVDELVPDKGRKVVVYGFNDYYKGALAAADHLSHLGYSDVKVLRGGIEAWTEAGKELAGKSKSIDFDSQMLTDGKYIVDTSKSRLRWTGRNLGSAHYGRVNVKSGFLVIKEDTITDGQATVDMNSITCDDIEDEDANRMLIKHLKSDDFFNTEEYPEAVFDMETFQPVLYAEPGEPNLQIVGTLQMRDKTEKIEMKGIFTGANGGYVFQSQFDIDRTRWNVLYGSGKIFEFLGKHLVNDLINLQLLITFSREEE